MENQDLTAGNTTANEPDYGDEEPELSVVRMPAVIVVACLFALSTGALGYVLHGGGQRPPDPLAMAQLAVQKEQIAAQESQSKRFADIQLKVMDDCEARGFIPVINGPNVDCRTAK